MIVINTLMTESNGYQRIKFPDAVARYERDVQVLQMLTT